MKYICPGMPNVRVQIFSKLMFCDGQKQTVDRALCQIMHNTLLAFTLLFTLTIDPNEATNICNGGLAENSVVT